MFEANLKTADFLKIFRPLVVSYALYFFLFLDWSFYEAAQELYRAEGIFKWLGLHWPGLPVLELLSLVLGLSGWAYLSDWKRPVSGGIFAVTVFALDGFHNMFGFINAQFHLVFFIFGCLWMEASERRRPGGILSQSAGFHFCQLVYVLVYFQSGLSKLLDAGLSWATTGGTLQIGLIRQGEPLGLWLAEQLPVVVALACVSLAFEVFFPALYMMKRWRPFLYLSSIGFHLGIYVFMGIGFFHLWVFAAALLLTLAVHRFRRRSVAQPALHAPAY